MYVKLNVYTKNHYITFNTIDFTTLAKLLCYYANSIQVDTKIEIKDR